MDLSQYAELFLAESREHLSACNQLLLDWERAPANPAPAPGGGRLVQVTLRAEAPIKGGRALLALKRAQALGAVQGVTPPQSAFESDEFDGRFSFRLDSPAAAAEIERVVRGAGDVEHVSVAGGERQPAAPRATAAGGATPEATPEKSRHIRVDLRRRGGLAGLIGGP